MHRDIFRGASSAARAAGQADQNTIADKLSLRLEPRPTHLAIVCFSYCQILNSGCPERFGLQFPADRAQDALQAPNDATECGAAFGEEACQ